MSLISLVFWLALVFTPGANAALYSDPRTPRCDGSVYQRGENVPASTSDRAHEIIHASSIRERGGVLAWIYQDRNGSLEFQAATDTSVPVSSIRSAMETFTDGKFAASQKFRALNGNYSWTQQVTGAYHPQASAGHSFVVHGCY